MRLLLVEDDDMLGSSLKRGLTQAGHTIEWVQDGEAALLATDTSQFDLMLLDVNLPKLSGVDVVKKLRQSNNNTPVLMLTAMDTLDYKVKGLDAGADDYLTKPFDFEELLARIRSLTRRTQERSDSILRCGEIELNTNSRTLTKSGETILLTAKELRVCSLLMERRNKIVSKAEIEESLYGWDEEVDSNTVEVTIYNLRKKLGKDFIKTLRGMGYIVKS